jgi:serine/threonine protein kinase
MPDETALKKIMMPILDGLEAIHQAGFLHRDIKPSNVFLRENGAPLLIDFGSARMSTGAISKNLRLIVSPGYSPLEQYMRDGHQGPWSDIYALSGVLYRAVTGGHPPDAVKRMKNDQVPAALAGARTRYDERFLRAIEWGLKLNEKVRPRSVAEWRELFSGRAPMSALNRGSVEETKLTGKAPLPDHRAHRPDAGKPARSRWLRRGAYLAAVAAVLALWWTQHNAERAIQKSEASPVAPGSKADAAGVSEAVAAEPPGVPSSPPVDSPASDPRAAQLPGPGANAGAEPDIPVALKKEFAAADSSGDGFLSPAEVRGRFAAVERNFPAVDADRDGRISLDELWQFRRKTFAGKPPR